MVHPELAVPNYLAALGACRRIRRPRTAKHKKAPVAYASMLGALVLARTVDDPDPSEEILKAVAVSGETSTA